MPKFDIMKTKLTILTLVLICASSFTYCQTFRYTDLAVQIISPEKNSTISSPVALNYSFSITNLGPDTLFPTDTLTYNTGHSFQFRPPETKMPIGKIIAPGDSIIVFDSISINSGKSTEKFSLFFVEVPMAYGPDNGHLPLVNEFSEDRNNNQASVVLNHIGNANTHNLSKQTLAIFPNPSKENYFFVQGVDNFKSITLLNPLMQEVPLKSLKHAADIVRVDYNDVTAGLYVLQVDFGTHTLKHKIILD